MFWRFPVLLMHSSTLRLISGGRQGQQALSALWLGVGALRQLQSFGKHRLTNKKRPVALGHRAEMLDRDCHASR
jgi:hypothetical protein